MSKTLIIVEKQSDWASYHQSDLVITFKEYLTHQYPQPSDFPTGKSTRLRIINLCKTHDYLSIGYYCSLLAEARGHSVIPSIRTFNDLSQRALTDLELSSIPSLLAEKWPQQEGGVNKFSIISFFGSTEEPAYSDFARKVFELFPCPILRIDLEFIGTWQIKRIKVISPNMLTDSEEDTFVKALEEFNGNVWRKKRANKQYRFDLAILVDPDEKLPPSDTKSLRKFVAAGKALGIDCQLISEKDYLRLPEFDALFIRSTTAIDNFTYRFAKRAEREGLVVIDDPTSILRCTNKIYLADLFHTNKVNAPKTKLFRKGEADKISAIEHELGYPMILKIPDGAFSIGVEKVKDRKELTTTLERLFKRSALILAQEFLYTNFDWRIGVLNNKPIYACRYYMVSNHWQIYQHNDKKTLEGGIETLPTFEVPKSVIDVALKATKPIGNGFYGVDIKEKEGIGYVIEVNDNPSIDHGIEDIYLGDQLYTIIMEEFLRRMELKHSHKN